MGSALIGLLVVFGGGHLILIIVPLINTLRASISVTSKLIWCAFLVLIPFVGVYVFHRKFASSLFHGQGYEVSAAEERARSGTLAPDDKD